MFWIRPQSASECLLVCGAVGTNFVNETENLSVTIAVVFYLYVIKNIIVVKREAVGERLFQKVPKSIAHKHCTRNSKSR